MKVNSFEDLIIWQNARVLCKEIYAATRSCLWKNDYRFASQITAASGSVMDNIAEGFERDGRKEMMQFLSIAKGSCGEVRSQIHRAFDAGYLDGEQYENFLNMTRSLSSGIHHMMISLQHSDIEGKKYKISSLQTP